MSITRKRDVVLVNQDRPCQVIRPIQDDHLAASGWQRLNRSVDFHIISGAVAEIVHSVSGPACGAGANGEAGGTLRVLHTQGGFCRRCRRRPRPTVGDRQGPSYTRRYISGTVKTDGACTGKICADGSGGGKFGGCCRRVAAG